MKKLWFMLAMMVCILASCSDGGSEDPTNPTPKPEEVKTEITIDSGIINNGLSFGVAEGEQSVSFSVNDNWTLSVASTTSGATWCKPSATSGSKGSATVKFTVEENTGYDDRSVSVTIKAGSVSKTFTITQKGADALLVTTTKYEVAQEGGQIEIEVKANIDYQMKISEDAKSWITEVESKGRALTTHKHQLDIALNEDAEKREGEITFKSGDKVETVKVYQAGGAILLLSQNEYTVSDAGETISVDIKSNIDFSVQMPDVDWISDEASSRGMSSHTLKYVISPNEDYDSRSAEIIFYDKNSDLKDTLTVVQVQKDAIVVAQNEYRIKSTGGDLNFEVNTNVDFEVSTSVDWIKQNTESRGLESKQLSFTIAENTSLENNREGLITISAGDLKQEIKVIQQKQIFFNFSATEVYIESDGDDFTIEVSTNGGYSVTMPQVDWLTQGEIHEVSTNTYINEFIVSDNATYDSREAEIKFRNVWTDEVVVVKVIQAQKDAIIISQKTYEAKSEGETIEVKISTNVDFEVVMPDVDWISQTESRGLTDHTLYFEVAENAGYEKRSAEIVVVNREFQLSDTITIHQDTSLKAGYADGIVIVTTAGTMKSVLGSDYLNITSLKVVGYINGDDIYYLRKMLGGSDFSEANWGSLTTLDLSEATIVEGGGYYYLDSSSEEYFTSDNVIGDCMFYHCSNLLNIVLPNNAVKIGKNAFSDNTLNSITLGNGLTSIDEYAFSVCNLNSIVIPDNVIKIGRNAFFGSTLTSITIGNGVTSIDDYAFDSCSDLTSIVIPDNVTWIGRCAFFSCDDLKSVTIGNGVTSIGDKAFSECSSLTSVTIGNGVTRIGERTFFKCSALTSIVIPDNVTFVPQEAFYGCIALTSVTIGNGAISIKESAFSGCSALASVTIGSGVTSIDKRAFYDCSTLTSIVIPDKVSSIGISAFEGCNGLTSITLGNGLRSIYDKSFSKCSALTSVVIPNNVTWIGEKAFYECGALKSVTIGSSVSRINGYAFSECPLSECYCYATTPPEFAKDNYGFTISPFSSSNATLYVPARSETAYINSKWVDYFKNIVEMD